MSVSVEYGRHGISSTRECEIRDKTVISTPLSTGALVFVSRIAFGCLEWWKSQILWRNEKFLMRISAVTFLFKTPNNISNFPLTTNHDRLHTLYFSRSRRICTSFISIANLFGLSLLTRPRLVVEGLATSVKPLSRAIGPPQALTISLSPEAESPLATPPR